MKDKQLMQMAFEQMASSSRGEHGMLCDFRKDFSGNYMSACERAAFWAWSKVEALYDYGENPVPFFDANIDQAKHDDFAGDTISFDLVKGRDITVGIKVLTLGDKLRVIDIDPAIPSVMDDLESRHRMFDRLPNRNGQVYRESPNLHFSDLSPEVQEKFTQAVDRLEKNAHRPSITVSPLTTSGDLQKIIEDADALGLNVKLDYPDAISNNNPHSMSFSVTTMNDIPKEPAFYNIDQMAFLPEIKEIKFDLEISGRLDTSLEKVREKAEDYNISLESPYSTPLNRGLTTSPSLDQGTEFIPAFTTTPEETKTEEEIPVFKPIHSLY